MAIDKGYINDLVQILGSLGAITTKPMFGGVGVFVDGKMFAKVSPSSVVSLKADDETRDKFTGAGMSKSGKMPYYELTANQLDDREELLEFAGLARDAALRGR